MHSLLYSIDCFSYTCTSLRYSPFKHPEHVSIFSMCEGAYLKLQGDIRRFFVQRRIHLTVSGLGKYYIDTACDETFARQGSEQKEGDQELMFCCISFSLAFDQE